MLLYYGLRVKCISNTVSHIVEWEMPFWVAFAISRTLNMITCFGRSNFLLVQLVLEKKKNLPLAQRSCYKSTKNCKKEMAKPMRNFTFSEASWWCINSSWEIRRIVRERRGWEENQDKCGSITRTTQQDLSLLSLKCKKKKKSLRPPKPWFFFQCTLTWSALSTSSCFSSTYIWMSWG